MQCGCGRIMRPLHTTSAEAHPDTGVVTYSFDNDEHNVSLSVMYDPREHKFGVCVRHSDDVYVGSAKAVVEPDERWEAHKGINGSVFIDCSNFGHDSRLYLTGDFPTVDVKLAYAQQIADILNRSNKGK